MLNIFLQDLGRAVVITFLFYFLFVVYIYVDTKRHKLNFSEEIRAIMASEFGIGILTFAVCVSMYAAESIVSGIILGIIYCIGFIAIFKKDKS